MLVLFHYLEISDFAKKKKKTLISRNIRTVYLPFKNSHSKIILKIILNHIVIKEINHYYLCKRKLQVWDVVLCREAPVFAACTFTLLLAFSAAPPRGPPRRPQLHGAPSSAAPPAPPHRGSSTLPTAARWTWMDLSRPEHNIWTNKAIILK